MWVYGGTTGSASYLRDVWRTGNGGECRRCRRSMAHRCCCSPHAALPRPAVHWVQVHPSPEALPRRAGAQAAVINGHLFLLGGRGTESPDGSNTISYTRDGSAGPALLPPPGVDRLPTPTKPRRPLPQRRGLHFRPSTPRRGPRAIALAPCATATTSTSWAGPRPTRRRPPYTLAPTAVRERAGWGRQGTTATLPATSPHLALRGAQ